MTPPLTRETLAELWRLRDVLLLAEDYVAVAYNRGGEAFAEARRKRCTARNFYRSALHRHSRALLAAAERGLDVEGGR